MTVDRRALLGAALASALGTVVAACSASSTPAGDAPAGPASSLDTPSRPPGVTPTTAATPTRSGTPPRLPTRAQIEARYDGVVPTHWGTSVSGVMTTMAGRRRFAALTFDACGGRGGGGYDAPLITVLRNEGVRATLFLNERWIAANPSAFDDLAADPLFDIANHGSRHLPLSVTGRSAYGIAGTRSPGEVYTEVMRNALELQQRLDRPCILFRSGTAHYDDVASRIVHDLSMRPVAFDVNGDAGATFTPAQVVAAMRGVRPGSIVIAHMNHPGHGTAAGMREALPRLKEAGFEFVHVRDHLV